MAYARKILVCGATGQQGGAVARSLLSRGQKVRVLTRSPEKARNLEKLGAEIVRGDFEDEYSVDKAIRGMDGVFLMGTPFEKGMEAEVEQGKVVIEACRDHGTPHLVYSSVCAANRGTGIPHFESKAKVETILKGSGQPYTILRPVWFMENFSSPWMKPSIDSGVLSTPIQPGIKLLMIAVADIGEFATEAFLRPFEFIGKEIDIAGDELAIEDIARLISCAVNREVLYKPIPEEKAEEMVGEDFARMYRWFNEQGYKVDIEELRSRWGIRLTSFSRWLGLSTLFRKAA